MPLFQRALSCRNYRLYFAGQLVSLAGTWMQQIAMLWLAYRLSSSAFVLGSIGFAGQIPSLVLAPLSGVWIDRLDRRRLLMWTQALSMMHALVLAVVTWQHWVSPGLLVFLALVLGCINAVDFPARQTAVGQLVDDPAYLPNAIALNSFLMNAGRFVGPSLAGFVVATAGEVVCFLLNALSYLAVLLALRAMRISFRIEPSSSTLKSFVDGNRYTFTHRQIWLPLILVAGISFCIMPYTVMMPFFARVAFSGDAGTYGLLIGSAGGGALLASVFLLTRREIRRLTLWVGFAATSAGISLGLFSATTQWWQGVPVLVALGFSTTLAFSGCNTLIQTRVEETFRGRVMAIFSMALLGMAPVGCLAVGAVSELIGIRLTLALCGLATLFIGFVYLKAMRK